jgi:hypothetical protein
MNLKLLIDLLRPNFKRVALFMIIFYLSINFGFHTIGQVGNLGVIGVSFAPISWLPFILEKGTNELLRAPPMFKDILLGSPFKLISILTFLY